MIKTIWNFVVNNGTIIMMVGRVIIIISLVVLAMNVFNQGSTRTIPVEVIIGGVVILAIGWIGNYSKKNKKEKVEEVDLDEL